MTLGRALLWAGRASAAASLVVLGLFLLGEEGGSGALTDADPLLFACFPVGVALGLAVGLARPAAGAATALVALAAFYLVHRLGHGGWPRGASFALFTAPAVLLLVGARSAGRRAHADTPTDRTR